MRFFLISLALACGPPIEVAPDGGSWPCPEGWIAGGLGGCAPASLLCGAPPCPIAGAWEDIAAPAPDWLPEPVPAPELAIECASGWIRDGDACDPSLRTDCPSGSEALPGGACTLTSECASGEFAEAPPEAPSAVYARAGADASIADGTRDRPYATITDAIAAGDWVLIAGEFSESIAIDGDVHIVGPCAARAAVEGAGRAFTVRGTLDLRGVTVRSTIVVEGRLAIRSARVEIDLGEAIAVTGGEADAEDLVVTATGPAAFLSTGIRASDARVSVRRSAIVGARGTAVSGLGTAQVAIEESTIRGRVISGAPGGAGITIASGASLELSRSFVESTARTAIAASDRPGSIAIDDTTIRDTSAIGGVFGYGIAIADAASVDLRGVQIEDATSIGLSIRGASVVRAERLRIAGTRYIEAEPSAALELGDGAELTLSRALLEGGPIVGLSIGDARASVSDVWIRDTFAGGGAHVRGTLTGARVRIEGSEGFGLLAEGVVDLDDLAVLALSPEAIGLSSRGEVSVARASIEGGIEARAGSIELEDAWIALAGEIAVSARERGHVRLTRVRSEIGGVLALGAEIDLEGSLVLGGTITALDGAIVRATRVRLEAAPGAGAIAVGGRIELVESAIANVAPFSGQGWGLVSIGGEVVARRSTIAGATVGAIAFERGDMSLEDVRVASGFGIWANDARVGATRVLVEESTLAIGGASAELALTDIIVRSSEIGVASSGGELDATRLAIDGATSAAIVSSRGAVRVRDVYVHDAAYGLYGELAVERAWIDEGGYGFFAPGAALSIDTGLISRQRDAAGVAASAPTLSGVIFSDNALDEIVARTFEELAVPSPPPLE